MTVPQLSYEYVGSELDLFAAARNWKQYVLRKLQPYLGPQVLEVGAGFGGTTRVFCSGRQRRWVCLEPDAKLAERISVDISSGDLPGCCEAVVGTVIDLSPAALFDTILYMDVLEHAEDDRGELILAASHLAPGGHLVVLSPAHQWLYSPFDAAIGHYRRYSKDSLGALTPPPLKLIRNDYLDSAGLLASLANKVLLRASMPTARQIAIWDGALVPVSRVLDPLLAFSVGKSVLGIWRSPGVSREAR